MNSYASTKYFSTKDDTKEHDGKNHDRSGRRKPVLLIRDVLKFSSRGERRGERALAARLTTLSGSKS